MPTPQLKSYDPSETVRGIQQLLVTDQKKIAFLFGDGTQSARRDDNTPYVPPIPEITRQIESELLRIPRYAPVITQIKAEYQGAPFNYTVETLMSNLEDKIRMIGEQSFTGLRREDLIAISSAIKSMLCEVVSVHKRIDEDTAKKLVHYDFAKWIKNADKKQAVEIFSTNYDYLFEIGFEEMEVPYYDGFSGSYRPFFNPVSLTDMNYLKNQTKLWKMNGSLGLTEIATATGSTNPKIIRSGVNGVDNQNLLMYSSAQKYSNSKKSPYAAYLDRLYYFVKQMDSVLFIVGYAFDNEHINERILSAINVSSSSHVFVFYDDSTAKPGESSLNSDSEIAKIAYNNRRVSIFGTHGAILGCVFGSWKLKREPDAADSHGVRSYYDYDPRVKGKTNRPDDTMWTGSGKLKLADFANFVDFLRNTIPKNEWED